MEKDYNTLSNSPCEWEKTIRTASLALTGKGGRGVGIYLFDSLSSITPEQLSQALAAMPEWRREKALRFKHEQGKKECAFSYLLLCQALKETYGIDQQPSFIYGEHGKPALASFPGKPASPSSPSSLSPLSSPSSSSLPHFNLSHCKQAIACVVSDHPVGIDVECLGRFSESLARHVLNADEYQQVITSPNPDLLFTRFWTQKEAIVKLTGRGIDDDLPNLLLKYSHVTLRTEEHLDKGYVLTVATIPYHE